MMLTGEQKENQDPKLQIDIRLIGQEYSAYQFAPYNYLLQKIRIANPWPQMGQEKITKFLKRICQMYNPIPYHNLTHGFDVMVNLDQFLISFGWKEKLSVSPIKRIFMLIAAFAHDAGHQGLTNAFYKGAKHPMAEPSNSPLEYLHISNLRKALRENEIEIQTKTLEEMTEMILRTDNYYHHWLLERCAQLKKISKDDFKNPKYALMAACLLLHAADLNNTFKKRDVSVMWTYLLYQQFEFQRGLEVQKGLKVSFPGVGSLKDTAKSNIGFLQHLVLPLYSGLCDLEDRFKQLYQKIQQNKNHWQAVLDG